MKKTSRFIRRNAVDYILIILPILLLVAVLSRGIALYVFPNGSTDCHAEVGFVIRSVDRETLTELNRTAERDFLLAGGECLTGAKVDTVTQTKTVVTDEDGSIIEVESEGLFDITFRVARTSGARAKDGTFLLGGVRRLAVGDSMKVTSDHAEYTVDFVKVRILD